MSENKVTYNTSDTFLKVKDVAEILKIKETSAYNLFNSPGFPSKKIKGGWRVRKSKLYEYFYNLNHYGNE